MRGKPWALTKKLRCIRITPADAGKTFPFRLSKSIVWDHPRGCGENILSPDASRRRMGSPPRMRGKPVFRLTVCISFRITPADAGKTKYLPLFKLLIRDHPRGCGENLSTALYIPFTKDHPRGCGENSFRSLARSPPSGSPPRMRGKPS